MMLKSFIHKANKRRMCIDFENVSQVFEEETGNATIALKNGLLVEVTQKYESVVRWWKKQQEEEDLEW